MPSKGKKKENGICLHCNRQREISGRGCCRTCIILAKMEGFIDKYPPRTGTPQRMAGQERLAKLNKLREQGLTNLQIAAKWQCSPGAVANIAYKARLRGEHVIPSPVKAVEYQGIEHGGGLGGKRNCPCKPCKERKAEYNKGYRARRKLLAGMPS